MPPSHVCLWSSVPYILYGGKEGVGTRGNFWRISSLPTKIGSNHPLEMLRNQQKIIYHDLLKCSLIVSFWSYCIIFLDVLSLFGWFRYTTKISSTLTYISAPWVSFHVYVFECLGYRVKCKISNVHRTKNNVQMTRWKKKNNLKWYLGALLVLSVNYGVIGVIKIS